MSEPILANKEVNVLQAVNLTLGTSAFLALADALPNLVDFKARVSLGAALYVSLLALWSTKLIVENHRSFAGERLRLRPRYAVFQLAMTITMFLAIIVSAKNAHKFEISIKWFDLAMAAGLIWLGVLAASFERNFDPKKYPFVWVASSLVSLVCATILIVRKIPLQSCSGSLILIAMLAMLVIDAKKSKSFSVV